MLRNRFLSLPAVLGIAFLLAGCDSDRSTPTTLQARLAPMQATDRHPDVPTFPSNPSDFVAGISNPYLAFTPGKVFRYAGETADGLETIVVEVTRKTKTILGVATTVVHDQAFLDGELIEDTIDWHAQDRAGNVWYFGEDSKTIEDRQVVSTAGSWQAGVNGARPGIIMLAELEVGTKYQQEFATGVAEDMAKIVGLSETVTVPYGSFTGCLQTLEWTPLEPGAREHKFYAPGVGQVLEVDAKGSGDRIELVSIKG